MSDWISNLFQQLLDALDEHHDMANDVAVIQSVTIFEQIELTREQLEDAKLIKKVENLRLRTPNQYLAYRLELLLQKWNNFLQKESGYLAVLPRKMSDSVFDAVIENDVEFFKTDDVYVLMHRLHNSFHQNGKVKDMATALNTISILHQIDIPDENLEKITAQFGKQLKRLRRLSTNRYLAEILTSLLVKWKELEKSDANQRFPSSPELEFDV